MIVRLSPASGGQSVLDTDLLQAPQQFGRLGLSIGLCLYVAIEGDKPGKQGAGSLGTVAVRLGQHLDPNSRHDKILLPGLCGLPRIRKGNLVLALTQSHQAIKCVCTNILAEFPDLGIL